MFIIISSISSSDMSKYNSFHDETNIVNCIFLVRDQRLSEKLSRLRELSEKRRWSWLDG